MTHQIVPGSASRGVLSPASWVRGDRAEGVHAFKRREGRHLPGRVRSPKPYGWGDPVPRPAWRDALGLAGFLVAWALFILLCGLIGMAR